MAGIVIEHYALELDDGTAVALKNVQGRDLDNGDRVEATGQRNGKAVFASAVRMLRAGSGHGVKHKANAGNTIEGTLKLLHADHFDSGRSDFIYEVHDDAGNVKRLDFAALPETLQPGMHVQVTGSPAADGVSVLPDTVAITALPMDTSTSAKEVAKAVRTNNVLVILMTFTDSGAIPFTQAQVQTVMGGGPGSGSVSEYFKEASFGQQLLNVTVTSWLATGAATPASCNWSTMGQLGRNAATAAGFNVASYQNLVYVFPAVSACGWSGLGYIGGNGVWINGGNQTNVYGHELGHNFGLLHAGSLRCSGVSIGGTCSVSEYGDPFDIMGNTSSMHYNAAQKLDLGWIAAGNVQTHTSGTKTYTLAPLENSGGTTYAVKIPAATNRTYWLEYRQPIGFDGGMSNYPNNGAQIRVANPFETLCSGCDAWSNDTELVDATPGTSTFTDAALTVGNTFTDSQYNITISVSAATSGALTVQVTSPSSLASTTTTLASSANPANTGALVTFTTSVTGSAPTGPVAFTADGSTLSGCGAVALSGSGNVKTATCSTSTLTAGT
ncbi:MAG TPA: hypothetical protein VFC24_00960, partial [Casimicrobiaceae bacterium]|nr:hypothetical protein [Casimicrobiaceae bacterium]